MSPSKDCLVWPGLSLLPGASSVLTYLQVIQQPFFLHVNKEAEVTDKAQGLLYFSFLPPFKKTEDQSESLSQGFTTAGQSCLVGKIQYSKGKKTLKTWKHSSKKIKNRQKCRTARNKCSQIRKLTFRFQWFSSFFPAALSNCSQIYQGKSCQDPASQMTVPLEGEIRGPCGMVEIREHRTTPLTGGKWLWLTRWLYGFIGWGS